MRRLFDGVADNAGKVAPGKVYHDQRAPIIHNGKSGPELVKARWGMPSPCSVLKTERDPGVTNIRNCPRRTGGVGLIRIIAAWCRSPASQSREARAGAFNGLRPVDDGPISFAGIETRDWRSVRKVKDGETTDDLFAFLTSPPNEEVGAIHPKAMPVILTRRGLGHDLCQLTSWLPRTAAPGVKAQDMLQACWRKRTASDHPRPS